VKYWCEDSSIIKSVNKAISKNRHGDIQQLLMKLKLKLFLRYVVFMRDDVDLLTVDEFC
jgi:hypothetical protein